ncbi:uncharacterized protein [Watersipora subatra]|uniref:uncharacterized protein isoform X2 n=1 Tax=Watersipora subatra TaxID=2589382 RepID=UPI00355B1AA8
MASRKTRVKSSMESKHKKELADLLSKYIDSAKGVAELTSLRELLQKTSSARRYKMVLKVRGVSDNTWTVLHAAAHQDDTDTFRCLSQGWTTEQLLIAAKIQTEAGATVMHIGAYHGSFATVRYLLENMEQDQKLELLKLKNKDGATALHRAMSCRKTDMVQLILGSLNSENQMELLSIRNDDGRFVTDLPEYQFQLPLQVTSCVKKLETLEEENKQQKQALSNADRKVETLLKENTKLQQALEKQQLDLEQRVTNQERTKLI